MPKAIGELSNDQKLKVNALMDYIATTPQNINYNIVREISKAIILNENHPYFDYYNEKITDEETEGPTKPTKPGKIEDATTGESGMNDTP